MMGVLRIAVFIIISIFFTSISTAAPSVVEILVQKGDTLNDLCKQYLVDPRYCSEIINLNQIQNPDRIEPGEKILIPISFLKVKPEESVEALVAFVKGSVSARGSSNSSWQIIQKGDSLPQGAQILTGTDSTAELTFEDGSTLLLRQKTLVTLTRLKRRENSLLRSVFLSIGRLLSFSHGAGTEVETTTAVAGTRGTKFGTMMLENGIMTTEVQEGAVTVAAMGKSVEVNAGEGTVVKQGSPPEAPRPLLASPAALDIQPLYASLPFEIHFAPVAGAEHYRILLSADAQGRDIILEKLIAKTEPFIVTELAEGAYYLLARSIDEQGIEGLDPQPISITLKIEKPSPKPMPPPPQKEESLVVGYTAIFMSMLAMILF